MNTDVPRAITPAEIETYHRDGVVLLTEMANPQQVYEELSRGAGTERILVPPLLIVRRTADDGETVVG